MELLNAQSSLVQRFLEAQGRQIANSLIEHQAQIKFTLPDKINILDQKTRKIKQLPVPEEHRNQIVGGVIDRLARGDIRAGLRHHLIDLEQSPHRSVSTCANLVRHVTTMQMVYSMLPSGRSVTYISSEGEEIPSIPISDDLEPESAITAKTDAIALEETAGEADRGELIVPFVPYARKFFLPQWVAFDEKGNLLVKSVNEAEAHIASMQRFLDVLHAAVALAPYIVADEEYQKKRYGMLGQLVNQGRSLAYFITKETIETIKRRATTQDLNRGLSLSLPFFDDRDLGLRTHDFEVIPAGRIMFVPAFVVRAARLEQAKVAQDTRLSQSTRIHLLSELKTLEQAFSTD